MVTWLYILDCSHQYGNTDYRKMKCCYAKIVEPIEITSTRAVALECFRNSGVKVTLAKNKKNISLASRWTSVLIPGNMFFLDSSSPSVVHQMKVKIRIKTSMMVKFINYTSSDSKVSNDKSGKKSTSWSGCFLWRGSTALQVLQNAFEKVHTTPSPDGSIACRKPHLTIGDLDLFLQFHSPKKRSPLVQKTSYSLGPAKKNGN